jgi:3-keto-L-gulonate-6-phosphate decarboxylase
LFGASCLTAECASIPLAISGGFTPNNIADVLADEWSVLIIGGAFVHARDPGDVLQAIRQAIESS